MFENEQQQRADHLGIGGLSTSLGKLLRIEKKRSASSVRERPTAKNKDVMKKKSSSDAADDLRPHYDFDYKAMRPNPYAGMDLKFKGRRAVLLDEDVAEVFDSQEAVNTVLRSAIKALRTAKSKTKPAGRRAS
ncbi:MAG TPA: hypothetical protein VJZ00_05495 [Thermoanaerobaculia bacterium]|nr:hypothetical protein [Thermoanaerobaculia bacterium]